MPPTKLKEIDDFDNYNEISTDHLKNSTFYGVYLKNSRYGINSKDLVLGVARNLFANHKWNSFVQIVDALTADLRIPGFILMKYFFVALYTQDIDKIDIIELKRFVINVLKILECKHEFLIELALYFIQNDQLIGEKKFLSDLHITVMAQSCSGNYSKNRRIMYNTFRLYEEYLDYLEWKVLNDPRNIQSTYVISVISVVSNKIKTNLKSLMEESEDKELHLDIVILMLLQLYDNDNELINAMEMLEKYVNKEVDHLNAHIYFYEFLCRYPDITPDSSLKIEALKNIVRLCPDSKYTLRLVSEMPHLTNLTYLEQIELLCDFLDYIHNRKSRKAWKLLNKILSKLDYEDSQICRTLKQYFDTRLKVWQKIHFRLTDLQTVLSQLQRFSRLRSSDSDYSSDISSCSEKSVNILTNEISGRDYYIFIYKGKVLYQISKFTILPSDSLQKYVNLINSIND